MAHASCPFCKRFDWGGAAAILEEGKYAHICLSTGSSRFDVEDQFNYCPVCGSFNPNRTTEVLREMIDSGSIFSKRELEDLICGCSAQIQEFCISKTEREPFENLIHKLKQMMGGLYDT